MEDDVPYSPTSNTDDSYNAEDSLTTPGNSGDDDDHTPSSDSVDDNGGQDIDIGTPSESVETAPSIHDLTGSELDLYLYEQGVAVQPLYDGSQTTVLQALVKHFYWFSSHPGISKEALSEVFKMERSILPHGNHMPGSYTEAMKLISPYLVKPLTFHVCPKECIIFRGQYYDLDACPKCGSSRYIRNNIPVKRFLYLPVGPRLQRLFGTACLSEILQAHSGASSERDEMFDLHDSPEWSRAYSVSGIFNGDKRGLSLALCSDGLNPYAHHRIQYSMWPLVLSILNLPRSMRSSFANLFLVGIIPGNGSKEPENLDPYVEILVDELLLLANATIYDAYLKSSFQMKFHVLSYVLDYPGMGKLFRTMGSGAYLGCMWCDLRGMSSSVCPYNYVHL